MRRRKSRKGAPGIVEVAARAGVSIATVSRCFSQPGMVRQPTRERIQSAAADLGYIRNRAAGSLNNRFSGTLALVVPTIDNAIFAELIEAFSNRLQAHDRTMFIAAHGYDLELEVAIVRSLLERRIDGIGLVGFDHNPVCTNMLDQRNVPVLAVWNYNPCAQLPCIGTDNEAAAADITTHVIANGHRDIAMLFPDTTNNDRARDRSNGARRALAGAGIAIAPQRWIRCSYDIAEAKQLVLKLMLGNPPTAIVCGNDIIAHGAYYACQELGLRIPDNISVVGIGDFRGSAHMSPGLTTVRLPARRIGVQAADSLIAMIDTGTTPANAHMCIDHSIMLRGSVAPIKTAP